MKQVQALYKVMQPMYMLPIALFNLPAKPHPRQRTLNN